MTNQEALEKLRLLRSGAPLSNIKAFKPKDYIQNIYGVACEAIEKQIPVEHHHTKIAVLSEPKLRFSVCPLCLSVILTAQDEYPKHCTWCSQAISWEV
jgi:hypothetical protein